MREGRTFSWGLTAVDGPRGPKRIGLSPGSPNPFRGSTALSFHLTDGAVIDLSVFGVDGRRIRTLASGWLTDRYDNRRLLAISLGLSRLLECSCGYFEMLAEEKGVVLQVSQQGPEPARQQVWADGALFVRALGNLISNALRYAPRGSTVMVSTQRLEADGSVLLEVSNEGPAIAPEHHEQLFERSFRVDGSRAGSATNSGLGLAIVKSIMELHGGRVGVHSAPGERTVFSLYYPGGVSAGMG